jgi:hypothetical protein
VHKADNLTADCLENIKRQCFSVVLELAGTRIIARLLNSEAHRHVHKGIPLDLIPS